MRALASTVGMSREQWLEYRRLGIGGSDAATILGVNRYKSPVELWLEKTGQSDDKEPGEPAYWGNVLEGVVREEFTRRTGISVTTVPYILQHSQYPYMLANVDGVCKHPDNGKVVFEAKTASAHKAHEWDNDAVPVEYTAQIQHYLGVTGYAGAYVTVLIGGNDYRWRFVKRDDALIHTLIQKEADFWQLVEDGVPPPVDGSESCADYIARRYPRSAPKSRIALPDSAAALIREYGEACSQLDAATDRKQLVANQLKALLGDSEVGTVGDASVRWQSISQSRFDSKLLQTERPELYTQYTRESSYRRLSVKMAG